MAINFSDGKQLIVEPYQMKIITSTEEKSNLTETIDINIF